MTNQRVANLEEFAKEVLQMSCAVLEESQHVVAARQANLERNGEVTLAVPKSIFPHPKPCGASKLVRIRSHTRSKSEFWEGGKAQTSR